MGSAPGFEERDRTAARTFARMPSDAGVERVVSLGGLRADRDELSAHLRSRRQVETVLAEGAYDLTVLRAAIIGGRGSASFELVRQLVARLPVVVTPRWVRTPVQPIAIDDVVAHLIGVLAVPETAGGTFEIGGPEVMRYEDVLRRTADVMDRPLSVVPVPVLTSTLSAYWFGLVTDVATSVAHPLVAGLRNPVVVIDHRIEDLVDVEARDFDSAVDRALAE